MPRTGRKATPALEIVLDGGATAYRPGDIITGRVLRAAPVVSSQATLAVRLHGRSKSKMVINRGQGGTYYYRGRFNFFDPDQNRQLLLDGPVHVPPGGAVQEWQFAVKVPPQPDPHTVAAQNKQQWSYLPLGPQDVAGHPLPPVFYASGVWLTTHYHCYVEYFLEASLQLGAAAGPSSAPASASADTASLPVNVTPAATPDGMITDFQPSRHSFLCHISSHRLVPGMETAALSFQQRTQHLFGSSKVPQLAFSLQVDCPGVLQVGNPNPVPFRLLVLPDRAQTTDAVREAAHVVVLTSLDFEIRAVTDLIVPGTLSTHTSKDTRRVGVDLGPAIARRPGGAIELPSADEKAAEPLDVGALLGLTLLSATPRGKKLFPTSYKGHLYPSLETYNIRHRHRLRWELTVAAAGESTTLSSEAEIVLLPSGDLPMEQPPMYYELPADEASPVSEDSMEKK